MEGMDQAQQGSAGLVPDAVDASGRPVHPHKAELDAELLEELPGEGAKGIVCSTAASCECQKQYGVADKGDTPVGPWRNEGSAVAVRHFYGCKGKSMGPYSEPIRSDEVKAQEEKQGWVNMPCGVHGNPLLARVVSKLGEGVFVRATACVFMEGRPLPLLKDLVAISLELGDA